MSDPKLFLIATEESGDRLGGPLMAALKVLRPDLAFEGIGGRAMQEQGMLSLFPIEPLSIIGFTAIPRQLPMLLARIREAANAVLAARPDVLVLIDAPDFTHRVARIVRRRDPSIRIVNYVSPTVWVWRPGRAKAMRAYVDRVMAVLPFEVEAHARLGGPPCSYVGHPLLSQRAVLRPGPQEAQRRDAEPPVLAVLPGSRHGEIRRLMPLFGATLERLRDNGTSFDAVLPTMPHLKDAVETAVASWRVRPRIVVGEEARQQTFRSARAAFAKSGTVTLELALAGVPMVTTYRVHPLEAFVARRVLKVPSIILANLVLGENAVPEFLQDDATAEAIAPALANVLGETPMRAAQLAAFERLDAIMGADDAPPSVRAAQVILQEIELARR